MSVIKARCPYCTSEIEAETERNYGICPHCNSTYNTQNAVGIGRISEEDVETLRSNRELLKSSLEKNDIGQIKFAARSICSIIGGDFLGNYYYSYAAKEKGNPFYYVDYLKLMDNEIGTPEEQEEVLNHLISHANLSDCALIDDYIERTVTDQAAYIAWLKKLKNRQTEIKRETWLKPMPRECYICYAPSELDVALEVASVLESLNIRCFIKDRNLEKANQKPATIEEAIKACKMIILVQSNRSLQAYNIKDEMICALNNNLKFIEFKIDESESDIAFKRYIPVENKIETKRLRGEFYGVLINMVRRELTPNPNFKARFNEMIKQELVSIEADLKKFARAVPQKAKAQTLEVLLEQVNSLIVEDRIDKADALAEQLMEGYKDDYRCFLAKVKVCTLNFTNYDDKTHQAYLKKCLDVANEEQKSEVIDLYANFQAKRFESLVGQIKLDPNHYDECLDAINSLEDEYNNLPQNTKDKIPFEIYARVGEAKDELEVLYAKKRDEQKYSNFARSTFFDVKGDTLVKYTGRNAMVQIPEGIRVIGEGCFQGLKSLKTVLIPYGVEEIKDSAFSDCSNLESIDLPDSLVNLGDDVFSSCEILREISIPEGVTRIGYRTFYNCSNLGIVNLGNNIQEIAGLAFANCSSLYKINIPDSVKVINKSVFSQCVSLQNITLPSELEEIKSESFYHCSRLENISIPANVKLICEEAFSGCNRLLNVYFNKSIEVIGRRAFLNCVKLRTINIPKSLVRIEEGAFKDCTGIKDVRFENGSMLQTIEKEAFYNCENIKSLELPSLITEITEASFYNLKRCEELILPAKLEKIEKLGLYGFESINSLTIPGACKSIGEKALFGIPQQAIVYFEDKDMLKEFKKIAKAEFYKFQVELDR